MELTKKNLIGSCIPLIPCNKLIVSVKIVKILNSLKTRLSDTETFSKAPIILLVMNTKIVLALIAIAFVTTTN